MKLVIYKGQRKFTVDNIVVPDQNCLQQIIDQHDAAEEISIHDFKLYNLRITATRGIMSKAEDLKNEELIKEIDEGINWHQETVN